MRRDFLEAQAGGAWDACVALAESVSDQAEQVESSLIRLFMAESVALLSGMPGLCPTQLLSVVRAWPEDEMLWEMFRQTTLDVRNFGLLGYACRMRVEQARDATVRAERMLEFGHYLRFLARAHREAVRAYVGALRLDPSLEVAVLVSLHQLYREMPLCEAAREAIQALCASRALTKEAMDALKAQLSDGIQKSRDAHARTLVRLARMTFLLWGDVGHGMALTIAAFEASVSVREEASGMIRALGLAMPDNKAVLEQCMLNLGVLEERRSALALGRKLLERFPHGTMRLKTALRLTREATAIASADADAAYFLQKAYSADPAAWLMEVEHMGWILKYALCSPLFAETLLSLLAQCGARKQFLDVRTALGRMVQGQGREEKGRVAFGPERTEQPDDDTQKDTSWKFVVSELLKYVPYSLSWAARCPMDENWMENLKTPEEAYPVFLDALNEIIGNEDFFMQVAMNENQSQQIQYMAKLDEMIAMYAEDTAKKNAFLEKKYQIAEILGDERTRLLCLKEILDTDPGNRFALEHVQSIDETTLKPHAQILLCQLRVMLNQDPEQDYALRSHLAELYRRTSQNNNAISLYHALIDEHPDLLEPRYQLLDLLIQLENWKSAENVMLALMNVETDARRRFDALVSLAKIQDEKRMMPSRALLTLFAAIDIIPDLPALHDLLCKISERIHSYSPLIDKYEELAKHSTSRDVRCQATARLARLYVDKMDQPEKAAKILNELYEQGGSDDLDFMRSMVPICRELELWNDYVRVLLRIIDRSSDKNEVIRSLLAVAKVYAVDPANYEQSLAFAKRACIMEPDNGEDWSGLADVMLARHEHQDAMRALQKALKYQDGMDRAQTLLKMAQINSELEDLVEATALFHQAAQLGAPLNALLPVVEHLIVLATMQHNQASFETLCNDLIAASPEEERAELLLQQAMTLARVFDDLESSRRIIQTLMPHFAEFDIAQNCVLADIFTLLHEEQAAIDLNFKILKNHELSDKQRLQRLQAMLTNATRLEDTDLIKKVCKAIMEFDPEDLHANFNLIQLDYHAGRWDVAVKRIQKFIARADRLNAESAMYLYYYYADILHAARHDNLALENLNKALAIRSDFKAAVDLKLTLYLEHEQWREALPSFKVLLALSQDDDERGAIHKRIAEVWHFYLNDPDKAIQEYEQALTLGGDVEDVPIRLLELYRTQGLWQKAAITAQVLAQAQTSSTDARLEYLGVLGDIWENHLHELALAENTYQEMFLAAPLREDIVSALVRVLIAQKKYDAFHPITERLITLTRREFEAGMTMFARMFGMSCRIPQARPVLKAILARLQEAFPGQRAVTSLSQYLDVPPEHGVDDLDHAKNTKSLQEPPSVPMSPPMRQRKQTVPSVGTLLTVDSGLLNPNLNSSLFDMPSLDNPRINENSSMTPRPSTDSFRRSAESGLKPRPSTDSFRRSAESGLKPRPSTDSFRHSDESGLGTRPSSPLRRSDESGLKPRPSTGSLRRSDESGLKPRPSTGSLRRSDESGLKPRPSSPLRRSDESGLKPRPSSPLRRSDESGFGTRPSSSLRRSDESGLGTRPSSPLRRSDESGLGTRPSSSLRCSDESGLDTRPSSPLRRSDESGLGTRPSSPLRRSDESGLGTRPSSPLRRSGESGLGHASANRVQLRDDDRKNTVPLDTNATSTLVERKHVETDDILPLLDAADVLIPIKP